MLKKILAIIFVIATVVLVSYLAYRPEWHAELMGDPKYYYSLANYFFNHYSLLGFKDPIAYPPAANVFFLSMGLIFPWSSSFSTYETTLVIMNILFLLALALIYWKFNHSLTSLVVFGLLMISAGPLILFRFDLLVVLLTALAIVSFHKSRSYLAVFYLALATMAKIFPVVLLPYFLLLILKKQNGFKNAFKIGCLYLLTILVSLIAYMYFFGDPPSSVAAMLNYNFTKSVHIESPLGSLLTLITIISNRPWPHTLNFINGLFVLPPEYLLGHLRIYRFTNSASLIFIYVLIFLTWKQLKKIEVATCLTIILTLLVASQVVSPQYLIWPFFLVPLIGATWFSTLRWKINLVLICLAFLLTQYVYPLNYPDFIFNFYYGGKESAVFWVNLFRNLCLILLAIRLQIELIRSVKLPLRQHGIF